MSGQPGTSTDEFGWESLDDDRTRTVNLTRGLDGFGWTLQGGSDAPHEMLPVFVSSLVEGGPAESGGVLKADALRRIDSKLMVGKTLAEVQAVIANVKAGQTITLELQKGILKYGPLDN